MLIFTNCSTEKDDEGCLKTANSIIKRIKQKSPETRLVSYERKSDLTDDFVKSNKLLLTGDIIRTLSKNKEKVLYIPFPAKSISTAIRVFIVSLLSGRNVNVLFTQITDISKPAKLLLKFSGAEFTVISTDTYNKLKGFIDKRRIKRIRVGVDVERFVPVSDEESRLLKKKHGFSTEKPIVLHVGHMQEGRNVEKLIAISEKYQVLLVTSTLTKIDENSALREKLISKENIRIIDEYVPEIQQIYQMCDVYFFPVRDEGHCIDSPLSCIEAMACGKSVVTTDFGEMKEFKGKYGIFFIDSFDSENLNALVEKALECRADTRGYAEEYDWDKAIKSIIQ